MFASFRALFTPAIVRLVLGVSLLSIGIGFAAGWTVRGWKAEAHDGKVQTQIVTDKLTARAAADGVIAKADTQNRQVVVRYVYRTRTIQEQSASIREQIHEAQDRSDADGVQRPLFSGEWVRLYNAALQPGSGVNPPAGGTAGTPGGAGAVVAQADQWGVLNVHEENAKRWAECRAQLNALIDSVGTSPTGVVTR